MFKNKFHKEINSLFASVSKNLMANYCLFKNNIVVKNYFRKNKKNSKVDNFNYTIDDFNKNNSKYSIERKQIKYGEDVPKFLQNTDLNFPKIQEEQPNFENNTYRGNKMIKTNKLKSGKSMRLIKKPMQKKMTKEERIERHKLQLEESNKTKFLTKEEIKLIENNETSIDRYNQ